MKTLLAVILLAALSSFSGCATELPTSQNSRRLMDRPGFQDCAQANPYWVLEALRTIDQLEQERDERKH